MKKKFTVVLGVILLFTSCYKSEVKSEEMSGKRNQLVGAPYETELDERGKDALAFVRLTEKNLGVVTRYKRQVVAGINHYFEFTKTGKPPMEVVVYENLDGKYEITSMGVLE